MSMKNASDDRRLCGAWSHLTLDMLVETAARARPDRRSFTDASDIRSWSDLPGLDLTARSLCDQSQNFARKVLTLGLKKGDPVLVAMPNQVAGVAMVLGLIAAGLVPCPVSVVSSTNEMQEAAEAIGAKAVFTVNRYADFTPSEAARQAASRFYGIRFVCAVGPEPGEGVVSLENWRDDELWADALPANAPGDVALITLDKNEGQISAHSRTHAQLLSDALALSAISGLTGRGSIVATFAPVSAAGFVSTIVAPLISGAKVTLHGPFDIEVLRNQILASPDSLVVLPDTVETALRSALKETLGDTVVVTRDLAAPRPALSGTARVTELISLGEAALWSVLRDPMRSKRKLPKHYSHPVSTALPRTSPLIEATVSARGQLTLNGFGVAAQVRTDSATAALPYETRWLARSEGNDQISVITERSDHIREEITLSVAAA
ncbi:MAG: AMP-binding protein [Beijerinckiaceae bacterium]